MKALIVTALVLISSSAALADEPVYPPDSYALFTDTECTVSDVMTTNMYEQVTLHLCLMNPSEASGVSAWECRVDIAGWMLETEWTCEGGGVDSDPNISYFRVDVGLDALALKPVDGLVRLATLTGYMASPSDQALIYIYPYPQPDRFVDQPGYFAGNDATKAVPAVVAAGLPYGSVWSASVNYLDCGCTDNEDQTWGGVKALYR